MDTRQLAKENTFNTSFSSNTDRQTPLQVHNHIIQIHPMIRQFCAFEAGMQPSKRFLWCYMLLLQLILKKVQAQWLKSRCHRKINKRIAVPLLKFPGLLITTELELWSPEQLWGMKLDISCNIEYILQYKWNPLYDQSQSPEVSYSELVFSSGGTSIGDPNTLARSIFIQVSQTFSFAIMI